MKAVILAGGKGTRLSPLTAGLPKPLVRILDKPVMAHILALLKHHGIEEAAVTVAYLAEEIKLQFGEESGGVRLRYYHETSPLGTAGGVKAAEDFLEKDSDDSFLVISGDAMCDFDLSRAMDFHREKGADATVLLSQSERPLEYGVVKCRGDGRIFGFVEKPEWSQVCSDQVNTGVYILKKRLLSKIPPHAVYDFSADLFPKMLSENDRLFGCPCDGYWRDIGSVASYYACNRDALYNQIKLHLPLDGMIGKTRGGGAWFCSYGASVDEDAVIGDGSIIGRGCRVESGATVSASILLDDCSVGKGAVIKDSILDRGVTVGKSALVAGQSVIGTKTKLMDGSLTVGLKLPAESRVRGNIPFEEKSSGGVFAEDSGFLFEPGADAEVFLRFGIALAKTFPGPFFVSWEENSPKWQGIISGLAREKAMFFLSDAPNRAVSSYSAAAVSSCALHLSSKEEGLSAELFMPDGFVAGLEDRKRLISAFRSCSAGTGEASERETERFFVTKMYTAALYSFLPRTGSKFSAEGRGCELFRAACEWRNLPLVSPGEAQIRLDFTDGLRVSFPDGKSYDRNHLAALFIGQSPARRIWLEPPVPEGLLRLSKSVMPLDDRGRKTHKPVTLASPEFYDPSFAAARLLSLEAELTSDRLKAALDELPQFCVMRRFVPHDSQNGSFMQSLTRLFSDSGENGLFIRRPQGILRIVPSALSGYRVWAEAVKTEAADELFSFAQQKIKENQSP